MTGPKWYDKRDGKGRLFREEEEEGKKEGGRRVKWNGRIQVI